jgi:hypothetical protein
MNTSRFAPVSLLPLLGALLLVAGSGCQSDFKPRTYSVNVTNESSSPVTVWLTKDGPAYERGWQSPEDLAAEARGAGEMVAGVVVPPGKTASVGPVHGTFASDTNAILRVYLGQHNFSDLLAISRGSPDRKDYELDASPARNDFTIVDRNGSVLVERSGGGGPVNMSNEPAEQR